MKKTLIAFFLVFTLALLLPACSGAEVMKYNETSTTINVAPGSQFEINLSANDTTGYT